jgi:photosystem II stability/assembly factor-like uncharacterized protein
LRRQLLWTAVFACVLEAACASHGIPVADRSDRDLGRDAPSGWFARQRNSADPIPARFRSDALEAAQAAGRFGRTAGTWSSAGPYNLGGRASALARDPNNGSVLWLGAADGGVFKSSDGGVGWTPTFDAQTALSIGAIAAHPTDSNVVYVGTGEENGLTYSYDGEGIYKTTDGGATWTSLGLAETRHIGKIAIDPADPSRLFAAAGGGVFNKDVNRGVYRSTNGGSVWQKVLYVADDSGAADVAIDPSNSARVFAAIWQRSKAGNQGYFGGANSGIYRSTDSGTSWARLTTGLPTGANVGRIGLAIAPSQTQTMYAVIYDASGSLLGVYRSTDGGDRWSKMSNTQLPGQFATFGYYFGQIRVNPTNASVVFVLDASLWRSTDGGKNFAVVPGSNYADKHDLIVGPGTQFLLANDGGFYKSTDDGATFSHATTLAIGQLYGLSVSRQNPLRRLAGTQDHGIARTKTGGTSDWQTVDGGDGFQVQIDPTNLNKVYGDLQDGDLQRSVNGGDTWMEALNGVDLSERSSWNTPIILDPTVPTTLYMGFQRVYRSIDSAVTWTPISPDLTNGPTLGATDAGTRAPAASSPPNPVNGTITVVRASPVDPGVVWAGTDDGNVWVTSNGGAIWTKRNPPGAAYWVTEIGPDPFEADKAYLTVTGFRAGDSMPYLRVTSDLGATWQTLSGGLPQVPLDDVIQDPAWHGRLYVASDVGVHLSDDAGASWSMLGSGMPSVVVSRLVLDDPSRTLFAGTYGRSVFSFALDQLPPPDGDGDGVDNNQDCAPADPSAFHAPGELAPIAVGRGSGSEAVISWPDASGSAGPATVYDVARGSLSALANSGTGASIGLACSIATTSTVDAAAPAQADGFYYLVRARNPCGIGTWGADSLGDPRLSSACP